MTTPAPAMKLVSQDQIPSPQNALIGVTPSDTLRHAAAALATLEAIRPGEIGADDEEGVGMTMLLRCIGRAVAFEARRLEARSN